jgi:flagellar protein FliO/FliZ
MSAALPLEAQELNETTMLLEEGVETESPEDIAVPLISTWDFLRMVLILGGVVGLVYIFFFLLKRGLGQKRLKNDLIRILGSTSLNGNKALHLIEVGNSIFLVGSAESGVALIAPIEDQESKDNIKLECSRNQSPEQRSFSRVLRDFFKPAKDNKLKGLGGTVDFMKEQQERLKRL